MQKLSVIGCGNPNRSDDGAGVYVAQALLRQYAAPPLTVGEASAVPRQVCIYDAGTAGMDVMFQAKGSDTLILVDASCSQSAPGSIFEVPGEEVENIPEPGYNLHDFRWDHALYAGRRIFQQSFPQNITVYLIEAGSLDFGLELSEAVKESADRVVDRIKQRIDSYLHAA